MDLSQITALVTGLTGLVTAVGVLVRQFKHERRVSAIISGKTSRKG